MSAKTPLFLIIIASISIITTESKLNISFSKDIYSKKPRKIFYYKPKYCTVIFKDRRKYVDNNVTVPMIYFVTPTFPHPEQIPELLKLSHTLMHVPRVYWIVADDNLKCSKQVAKLLERTGLPYSHISSPQPNIRRSSPFPAGVVPRGVANRRAALKWIHKFVKDGILYFGDDDNVYDLELFDEIRKTKKLSMFPVGLAGFYGVSAPLVENDKVVGFFDSWYARRKFPVDMAGFAINIKYLSPNATMPFEAGKLEDGFLKSSGYEIENIEPLADNCTKILVWHTQIKRVRKPELQANMNSVAHSNYTNLAPLLETLSDMNIVRLNQKKGINAMIQAKGEVVNKLGDL